MTREEAEALADFKFANEKNVCIHAYVQITHDFVAGCILSQIFYWFSPDKDGKSKLRVKKKDGWWLAKSRTDWENEICISPKQYDRAIKILKDMGLIETKLYKFNGVPVVHIRPIPENCNKAVAQWKEDTINELMESENESENIENESEYVENDAGNTDEYWISPKGKNPFSPKGKIHFDERVKSITDTTTDTTDINYQKRYNRSISKRNTTPFSFDYVEKQIDSICDDTYDAEEIKDIFRYYYLKYYGKQGKHHPQLSTDNIAKIIDRMSELDSDILDFATMRELIDKHFKRNYGYKIDYNINHFMSEGIIDRLVMEYAL